MFGAASFIFLHSTFTAQFEFATLYVSVLDGICFHSVLEISISLYLQGCYEKMVGWFKDNSVYVIGSFSVILAMEVRSAIFSKKLYKDSVLRHLSSKK